MKTVRSLPDKSLAQYSEDDQRLLRGPSVENHLDQIRTALALCVVLQRALECVDDAAQPRGLSQDAATALADLCEDAWASAQALSEAIPGDVQLLSVVDDGRAADTSR